MIFADSLDDKKRQMAEKQKGLFGSTKSFKEAATKVMDINGRQLFQFKNPLSDMDNTGVMRWLCSHLTYEDDNEMLGNFLKVCADNGVSGITACKWTDGILESKAYNVSDSRLRALILVIRDDAMKHQPLPSLFGGVKAEDAHMAKMRKNKERAVLEEQWELDIPVIDRQSTEETGKFKIGIARNAELSRIGWVAFAALSQNPDIHKLKAKRDYRVGLTDNLDAFTTTPAMRISDLNSEQTKKLCIVHF